MPSFSSHQYVFLFLWVLAEQFGLPVPAVPVLLATGAVASTGQVSYTLALLMVIAACTIPDTCWYLLGRFKGARMLSLLCRMSLEPDTCVKDTRERFQSRRVLSLLTAHFIPGGGVLTAPLAGVLKMRYRDYLALDAAGSLLWGIFYIALGAIFQKQIDLALIVLRRLGTSFFAAAVAIALVYVLYKWIERRRFLRSIRIARMDPLELMSRIENRDDLLIADLRSDFDFESNPVVIPGALRISASELEARAEEISRYREIALYCT
jgi:membrane protein DedA with SNARE-associated domain